MQLHKLCKMKMLSAEDSILHYFRSLHSLSQDEHFDWSWQVKNRQIRTMSATTTMTAIIATL